MTVILRQVKPRESEIVYELMHHNTQWKETDAPYFSYENQHLRRLKTGIFMTYVIFRENALLSLNTVLSVRSLFTGSMNHHAG